jgi:hypothetical protein
VCAEYGIFLCYTGSYIKFPMDCQVIFEGGRATYEKSIYLDSGTTKNRIKVISNCYHTECVNFRYEPYLEFQWLSWFRRSCWYYNLLKLEEWALEKIGGRTGLAVWRKFQAWMSVIQDSRGAHKPRYSRDLLIYVGSKVSGTTYYETETH